MLNSSQRARLIRNFFIASIPSLLLAFIYVLVGMRLQGNPQYNLIDFYIFLAVESISLVLGSLLYYIHHHDLSETLAFAGDILFWLGLGAEDVFVYLICMSLGKCSYPGNLSWLNDTVYGYFATNWFGYENVEFTFLVAWVVWSGLLLLLLNIAMYLIDLDDFNDKFLN